MRRTMSQQERRAIEQCLFMVHPPDPEPETITPTEIDREARRILRIRARDADARAIIEGIKWGLMIAFILAALFF